MISAALAGAFAASSADSCELASPLFDRLLEVGYDDDGMKELGWTPVAFDRTYGELKEKQNLTKSPFKVSCRSRLTHFISRMSGMRCDPTLISEMFRRTIFLTLYMSVPDCGL